MVALKVCLQKASRKLTLISDFSFVPRYISSNKACHGHGVAAEKTDKSFRNRVLFDAVLIGCNCCVGLKPRSGKHSHSLKNTFAMRKLAIP